MNKHAHPTYPTLADVPDIEHDTDFPAGFESALDDNGCAVTTGAASVQAFCYSHAWPNAAQRKVALAFARKGPSPNQQTTLALAAFPDASDAQKQAIGNGTRAQRFLGAFSGSLPALDANGNPVSGGSALSETCTDPKAATFALLLYDLQHGAIEGSPGAVA